MDTCVVCHAKINPFDRSINIERDNAYVWHLECVDSDGNAVEEKKV